MVERCSQALVGVPAAPRIGALLDAPLHAGDRHAEWALSGVLGVRYLPHAAQSMASLDSVVVSGGCVGGSAEAPQRGAHAAAGGRRLSNRHTVWYLHT